MLFPVSVAIAIIVVKYVLPSFLLTLDSKEHTMIRKTVAVS